ncbi:MAG: DoxX family membrane protein [Deltaproteobacteria bacterium]|nr:MAG: DoxX family membrane protein [Deltaproteobacteria bacterium]
MRELLTWLARGAFRPQPIARLAVLRILASLAILGFMASRIHHADDWLSVAGFRVPEGTDWRQPLSLPALPEWAAWSVAAALAVAGLATAAGAFTRWASAVFAALLAYVALADRLSAFTVSKLAPVIALALCLSPSGARYSVDAWRQARRDPSAPRPELVSGGCVLFFQVLLPVFYFASGLAKARGDWRTHPYVLWTHLHDSYQTTVSWFIANHAPTWMWTVTQRAVLVFECGAPLWFALPWTRPFALAFGVGMHLMIGLMFGPVIWFSLLMMTLLVASYAPERWLTRALQLGRRLPPR